MESLLKLSGLLGEEDVSTDLGTLEKRLADQAAQNKDQGARKQSETSTNDRTPTRSPGKSESQAESGTNDTEMSSTDDKAPKSTARTGSTEKREEVEALSDMMCSLVTTNCGETRYIGKTYYASHPGSD
jgi:hypothetical protein